MRWVIYHARVKQNIYTKLWINILREEITLILEHRWEDSIRTDLAEIF
jgi:hypothetical protein